MAGYEPTEIEAKQPKFDVYSMLLLLALIALIIGCVFLAMEMQQYEWQMKPPGI